MNLLKPPVALTQHFFTKVAAVAVLLQLCCCAGPLQVAVPDQFKLVADKMPVKGVNGFAFRQKLSFGPYQTSGIRRGWITTTERQRYTAEQRLLKVFANIGHYSSVNRQQNRYHFKLNHLSSSLQVFCQEVFTRQDLNLDTGNPLLGVLGQTQQSEYDFTAAILPQADTAAAWQLVLYSLYNRAADTAKSIFSLPFKQEEGWVSNGHQTLAIKPLRLQQTITQKGREARLPFRILTGYELRTTDGVIAVIDSLSNHFWVYNQLDGDTKMLAAAVCAALLLRQLQHTNA